MRLLNSVPHVRICGENERAFDHLRRFFQSYERAGQRRNTTRFSSIAWMTPCRREEFVLKMCRFVTDVYCSVSPLDVWGFKEIRYGQGPYREFVNDLGFFRLLFPSMKIIFNTRDLDACSTSGWWARSPTQSKKVLARIETNFRRFYEANRSYCYWARYEDLYRGSEVVANLFHFLGIEHRDEYEAPLDMVLKE